MSIVSSMNNKKMTLNIKKIKIVIKKYKADKQYWHFQTII